VRTVSASYSSRCRLGGIMEWGPAISTTGYPPSRAVQPNARATGLQTDQAKGRAAVQPTRFSLHPILIEGTAECSMGGQRGAGVCGGIPATKPERRGEQIFVRRKIQMAVAPGETQAMVSGEIALSEGMRCFGRA